MKMVSHGLQASCIATAALLGVGTTLAADDPAVALTATPKPKFSLVAGTYTNVRTVKITDTGRTAKIYYTTDGSTPSTKSTLYSVPVAIGSTTTLKAIATEANHTTSAVESAKYTITCPVDAAGCVPPLAPANVAGESAFDLYLGAATGTAQAFSSLLVDYAGFAAQGTVPFTASGSQDVFTNVTADPAGNLWAFEGLFEPSIGFDASFAIVEFQHAAGSPSTLVPTTVASLPSTPAVSVANAAFDRAGNLWVDEFNLTTLDGTSSIVEYTAASGYTQAATVIPYSGAGGPAGNNCAGGASMAFTAGGNLEALENYSNGTGGCQVRMVEYTPAGTPVTSTYYPNGYAGAEGSIAIDASGNLWVLAQADGCTTNPTNPTASGCSIPSEIYEVSGKGVLLQTIAAPASPNNQQKSYSPAFDANGNLWFLNAAIRHSNWCSAASLQTASVYEIPAGTTTPIQQAAFSTACLAGPLTQYGSLAVTPVPAGLPQF